MHRIYVVNWRVEYVTWSISQMCLGYFDTMVVVVDVANIKYTQELLSF